MSIAWTTIQAALQNWVQAASGFADSQVIWVGQNRQRPAAPYIALRISTVRRVGFDWLETVDNPLVVPDQVVTSVNAATNVITRAAHTLLTGDGPFRYVTTGTWSGMLEKDFWVIRLAADTYQVAESFQDAMNGMPYDIPSAGTGTHTLEDTADTVRQGSEIFLRSRGQREAVLSIQCYGGSPLGTTAPVAVLNAVVSGANLESRRAAFLAAGIGMAHFEPVRSLDGLLGASVYESRAILECRFFLAEEVSEATTYIQFAELENLITGTSEYVPEDPNP